MNIKNYVFNNSNEILLFLLLPIVIIMKGTKKGIVTTTNFTYRDFIDEHEFGVLKH